MVVDLVGRHRADDAQVVGSLGGVRQEFGELDAALSMAVESTRTGPDLRVGPDEGQFQFLRRGIGKRLSVPSLHLRLGIQQIQLAGAARLEEEDYILGGRPIVGVAHSERIGFGPEEPVVCQQVGERDGAQAASGFLKEAPAGAQAGSRPNLRLPWRPLPSVPQHRQLQPTNRRCESFQERKNYTLRLHIRTCRCSFHRQPLAWRTRADRHDRHNQGQHLRDMLLPNDHSRRRLCDL